MKNKKSRPENATGLRRKAEEIFFKQADHSPEDLSALSPEEIRQMTNELRVQKIELEMQNEELQRAQAEVALREREYKTLVENIPQKIFIKDRTSVYLSCNKSYARDLGILPEEIKGKSDYVFYPETLADKYRADDQRIISSGETETIDEEYLMDGQTFWVHTVKTPLRDNQGNIVGILGIFNDITQLKQSEDTLRDKEERYRSLTEAIGQSNIGLFLVDADYRVRFMNQPMIEAFGDQTGKICYESVGQIDSPCSYCKLPEVVQQRKAVSYQPITAIDKIFDIVAIPFQDTDGATCKLEILHDITKNKQAEEALLRSEQRHRRFYESGLLGVIYWNMQGQITEANDKFLEMVGYTRDDLAAGRIDWVNMTPPEFRYLDDYSIVELKNIGVNKIPFEKEYFHRDGTRVPIILAGAMLDDERNNGVAFVLDITERKRMEAEHKKLDQQYQQAQKMESVGRLAGGVAHDFNNLLTIILSYTQMTMEEIDSTGPIHDDLQQVLIAAQKSADITRQLLAFARQQTVSPQVLDFNQTVGQMLKMLQRLMGEDIHLTWRPGSGVWPVKMDPSQMDQILANLCVNSRDAIASVGEVTLETDNAILDEAYCAEHPGFVPGEFVLLTVSDTGAGMDRQTLDHIFEPFFTTKGMGQGTGLGLATVYGIIKQNDGFINVYSEPGQGTIFRIYLPRHAGEPGLSKLMDETPIPEGNHETILIIEDDLSILNLTRRMLEELNYNVLAETSPNQTLAQAQKYSDRIHLLLTDVIMPEMTGPDLAKKLKALYPDLKVLFMSGYTADVIAQRGLLSEDVHLIPKPFSRKDMAVKIREALGKTNLVTSQ